MARAYLDTNILLDAAVSGRVDHEAAVRLLEERPAELAASAGSLKDFYYIARRCGMADAACRAYLRVFLDRLDVLADDRAICIAALESPEPDYEDATKASAALSWGPTSL